MKIYVGFSRIAVFNFHSHGLMRTVVVFGVTISCICMVGPPLPGYEGPNNW
jgi:hypothetical protein